MRCHRQLGTTAKGLQFSLAIGNSREHALPRCVVQLLGIAYPGLQLAIAGNMRYLETRVLATPKPDQAGL